MANVVITVLNLETLKYMNGNNNLTVELFNFQLRSSQVVLLTQHLGGVIGIWQKRQNSMNQGRTSGICDLFIFGFFLQGANVALCSSVGSLRVQLWISGIFQEVSLCKLGCVWFVIKLCFPEKICSAKNFNFLAPPMQIENQVKSFLVHKTPLELHSWTTLQHSPKELK